MMPSSPLINFTSAVNAKIVRTWGAAGAALAAACRHYQFPHAVDQNVPVGESLAALMSETGWNVLQLLLPFQEKISGNPPRFLCAS
jgi:hypothetical protein